MSGKEAKGRWASIAAALKEVRACDRNRLRREFERLKKKASGNNFHAQERLLADIRVSVEEKRRRLNKPPRLHYPEDLPITARRKDIVESIRAHQVIVLSGETGSGKSTQIPKMCIEAGRGVDGLIGCTQPRRIAALTVASRIAEELGDEEVVGSKIRFRERSSKRNFIRVMTDGILLAETQTHPNLNNYDTIIIDEAHERSLNIDVLLGMLKLLLARRAFLKLIITSATLDTEKFSRHFNDAPIIEVSGRSFPVDIHYEAAKEEQMEMSLAERSTFILAELLRSSSRGDILVFLPTEQDIRETMGLAKKNFSNRLDILPLFARLPASEQKKVFHRTGRRKLVVATNVAETSLTIPGIRYVVDSGLARISRYNPGTTTHGLPVDRVSQASADQRAGRCGRVENGVCVRMYSLADYESRRQFTLPEIQRTNLAEVILQLIHQGISDIESFPFVDPPDSAGIRDGLRTLKEIGALIPSHGKQRKRYLSEDGRLMARLPLDPRLAKVLIQADREGCLGDVLPVASALGLPDPRERPPGKTGSAERAQRVFVDEQSDFITALNIWDGFRTYAFKGSYSGKLKKFCSEHYLSFPRMREWMDIHRQLTLIMEENGFRPRRHRVEPSLDAQGRFSPRYSMIHRSLLSGFLSHIARLEGQGVYEATRNRKLRIHPSSALYRGKSQWIMSTEIVQTSQLYGRSVAAINPDWLIDLGDGLLKREWISPRWNPKSGTVVANEQLRLYGFLLSGDTIIPYGTVRPHEARDIFIRSALVDYDIPSLSAYGFLKSNKLLIKRLGQVEEKLRRRDLLAGRDAFEAFYNRNLPMDVMDLGSLNRHIKDNGEEHLLMHESDIITGVFSLNELNAFPDTGEIAGQQWKITYVFNPKSPEDGATLSIPAGHLSELSPKKTDWMVPGLLKEKVVALMRNLPKQYRKMLIPIAKNAEAAIKGMNIVNNDLVHALCEWLYKVRRIDIPPTAWKPDDLPDYLKVRFRLTDGSGKEIAAGRNPSEFFLEPTSSTGGGFIQAYRDENELSGLTKWPDGKVAESVELPGGVRLWPALQDDGSSVSLRFFNERKEAENAQRQAQIRLARIHWAREIKDFRRALFLPDSIKPAALHLGGVKALENQLWERVLSEIFATEFIRSSEDWKTLLFQGGARLYTLAESCRERIMSVLETYGRLRRDLNNLLQESHRPHFIKDRFDDMSEILPDDFIKRYDTEQWVALSRWLQAVLIRARRGLSDPAKDKRSAEIWEALSKRLQELKESLSPMASTEKLIAIAKAEVSLQELRVALFAAGELRSVGKVSENSLKKELDEIERMF